MLTAADLGPPFVQEPAGSGSGGSTVSTSGCPALDKLLSSTVNGTNPDSQEANFDGGDTPVFIGEYLGGDSPAAVSAEFAQLKSAFQQCTSWVWKDSATGTTVDFTLSPITFGTAQSTSMRLDGQVQGTEINGYLDFDDLGSVLLGYIYFQAGSGSSQLAYTFYTTAVTKAQHVLAVGPVASV